MKISPIIPAMVSAAMVAFSAPQAAALSIDLEFSPSAQTVGLGGFAFVDLIATESSGPGALGAFSVDVGFDPGIISFVGASGGTGFGTSTGLFSSHPGGGVLKLDETSLETPATLVAGQPDSFVLATLEFSVGAIGTSPLTFDFVDLSDEDGFPITGTTTSGSIAVTSSSVPDGGTSLALFGLALGGMAGLRRLCRAGTA